MSAAHTPGPWIARLDEFAFSNTGQRAILTQVGEDEMPTHIAFVSPIAERKRNTKYDAPDPEREANARLLAAAPELLDLAIALQKAINDGLIRNPHDEDSVGVLSDFANAAIAKATGAAP